MRKILQVSNAEYQKIPAMSFSSFKEFMKTPAHYKAYISAPPTKSTDPQDLGTAVHAAILEPNEFDSKYKVVEGRRNRNDVKEQIAFWISQGATVIKPEHYEAAVRLRDKVYSHEVIGPLLSGGVKEHSVLTTCRLSGAPIKCRPDHFNESAGVALDLKTFDDLSDKAIDSQIRRMKYHLQALHYLNTLSSYLQRDIRLFGNIFLEPQDPWSVRFVGIEEASLEKAAIDFQYVDNLRRFKECLEADEWPGYSNEPYQASVL